MKLHLYLLVISLFSMSVFSAQDASSTNLNSDSNISSSAKKILKKVGRKTRDLSCDWTEDKAKCEKEEAEHLKANAADKLDTKKRKMEQAQKDYEDELLKTQTK